MHGKGPGCIKYLRSANRYLFRLLIVCTHVWENSYSFSKWGLWAGMGFPTGGKAWLRWCTLLSVVVVTTATVENKPTDRFLNSGYWSGTLAWHSEPTGHILVRLLLSRGRIFKIADCINQLYFFTDRMTLRTKMEDITFMYVYEAYRQLCNFPHGSLCAPCECSRCQPVGRGASIFHRPRASPHA